MQIAASSRSSLFRGRRSTMSSSNPTRHIATANAASHGRLWYGIPDRMPMNPIAATKPAITPRPPSNAVGLACGRSLEGCATIPKRTPAAFATGIIAAATRNADNGVSAISKPVVNLALYARFFARLGCLPWGSMRAVSRLRPLALKANPVVSSPNLPVNAQNAQNRTTASRSTNPDQRGRANG
jgi:hypothetical protein